MKTTARGGCMMHKEFSKGCLGPSVFDWFLSCQHHNTVGGEYGEYCLSCQLIVLPHNEKIRKKLAKLKWEALLSHDEATA